MAKNLVLVLTARLIIEAEEGEIAQDEFIEQLKQEILGELDGNAFAVEDDEVTATATLDIQNVDIHEEES